jgi:L,D-peptidoglycan transpeptidase YkuD (ErfK/YbiS/YcfS/YnhG family)
MVREVIANPFKRKKTLLTGHRLCGTSRPGKPITGFCSAMRSYSKNRDGNRVGRKLGAVHLLTVRPRPANPRQCLVAAGGRVLPGALGRGGISAFKREGDGATPLAAMRLLGGYVRRGRMPAASPLPLVAIRPDMGWCDAPADPNYNRPVRLPFRASHEEMKRPDRLYDAVIVLDWNVAMRVRNRGSAIFLHVARPGFAPTEGCVAIAPAAMRWLLPRLSRHTVLRVVRQASS